jgi:hypothetical protein
VPRAARSISRSRNARKSGPGGRNRGPLPRRLGPVRARLVDPLLRLVGKDSQSYARIERARALDRLARDAVLAELVGEGFAADTARQALDAALQGARGR